MWPLDPAAVHLTIDSGSSIVGVILGDISDVEPGPGSSSYSNEFPTISEVSKTRGKHHSAFQIVCCNKVCYFG